MTGLSEDCLGLVSKHEVELFLWGGLMDTLSRLQLLELGLRRSVNKHCHILSV